MDTFEQQIRSWWVNNKSRRCATHFSKLTTTPAGRHVRGLCFYCCLLRRFTRFSAKRRIPCQPPPHVTERGGKAIFLLIFVHKLFVASSSPSSPHRPPPPPPFHAACSVSQRDFPVCCCCRCAAIWCVYTHSFPRAQFSRTALGCRVANFPQPRCCQFKCFRNYEHLKKMFISQAKYIFFQVHMVDFDLKRFSDSDLKIITF